MRQAQTIRATTADKITATELYAAGFGLFLGLAVVKFGNPVILDQVITPPVSWSDAWANSWPLSWANWALLTLGLMGVVLGLAKRPHWPGSRWLWILPMIWFGWQILSATQSLYAHLAAVTLWQFGGCAACYFLGALVIGEGRGWKFVMLGVLVAFAFCLVRAVDQRLFEFPRERQYLMESERAGWTNMPPDLFQELKREGAIINTNGVDVANPVILAKYGDEPPPNVDNLHLILSRLLLPRPRVNGTLVYPNALAGVVLLLWPAALVLVLQGTRNLRDVTRVAAIGLTIFLGAAALFWSGSKSGWLIALGVGVFWLCRLKWPRRLKWVLVIVLVAGGLVVFGLRFQSYFAKGATSVGARFDYWRVAARVAVEHPGFGTGPGTFQRPYGLLKKPESEMARLVHNDYLEQFSDSGLVGGLSYAGWIGLLLWTIGRRVWGTGAWLEFGIFAGLLGWFAQGLIEFSLFVPALAWTAFTLGGCLLRRTGNQFDKPKPGD